MDYNYYVDEILGDTIVQPEETEPVMMWQNPEQMDVEECPSSFQDDPPFADSPLFFEPYNFTTTMESQPMDFSTTGFDTTFVKPFIVELPEGTLSPLTPPMLERQESLCTSLWNS
jgi:hypothetical protein